MKTNIRNSRKFRRGSLLGLVMIIGLCLGFLGLGMLQLGYWSRSNAAISTYIINARMAADAGLQAALYQMNLDFPAFPTLGTQSGTLDNSTASYIYDVNNPVPEHFQIDSQGTCAGETRTVHAITDYSSMFDYALFVTNDLFIHSGALIDAYDSNDGPYGGSNSGLPVVIGSETELPSQGNPEEGIGLDSGVLITGSIAVGTGLSDDQIWGTGGGSHGVLDSDPENIQGSAYSPEISYIWGPVPSPPPFELILNSKIELASDANESIGIGGTYTEAQVIKCQGLDMKEGSLLVINGNVTLYLEKTPQNGTGCLDMITNAELRINPGSSLTLYVDDTFNSTNTNYINNLTQNPAAFVIYGTAPDTLVHPPVWDVGAKGDFYGVLYAPNIDLIIRNDGDIYGSIAARSCELKNSGNIHYDLQLANNAEFFTGYLIQRWWEEAE